MIEQRQEELDESHLSFAGEIKSRWSVDNLRKDPATISDEFLEKFQTAFDPPPSFLENFIAIFL